MSKSPTPQTRFEVAVHEGYQFEEGRHHKRVKLLISFADASRQWIGWYLFAEGLTGPAAKAYDDLLMNWHDPKRAPRAAKTIQFGDGAVDRSPIQLKNAKAVDKLNAGLSAAPASRIQDAKFVPIKKADGQGTADAMMRLDLTMSFDFANGPRREIVFARVSMLSPERPEGSIYPAVGWLMSLGREPFSRGLIAPSHDLSDAAQTPI